MRKPQQKGPSIYSNSHICSIWALEVTTTNLSWISCGPHVIYSVCIRVQIRRPYQGPMVWTVDVMDCRAMFRVDMRFCTGTLLWPLLEAFYGIHVESMSFGPTSIVEARKFEHERPHTPNQRSKASINHPTSMYQCNRIWRLFGPTAQTLCKGTPTSMLQLFEVYCNIDSSSCGLRLPLPCGQCYLGLLGFALLAPTMYMIYGG